ncbi:NAD-dependent epimerase/dehydratase family protein [Paracrocinitomix mangrovi]|uniref:NAD-dependent epimerase/dehydratase family protein n=1 Tax=Paracrocinitomix mangrovi TaxID=2862509 RepID=UPI001C8ED55E|nr:NAD-dependent epimerase/dehydratase family protein [Paracrocinitomix mangrovi]UKN00778.1 NAD-dependent epimerase/dehydratase family protein [Paracrocinitomix mangrovi]
MIFVTGGTGLLGTHIILELLARGEKVRALKRSDARLEMVKKVFNFYHGNKGDQIFNQIEWVEGDITDVYSLDKAIEGCRVVYHCAGMVSFLKKDREKLWLVNKEGTANVVNVCIHHKVDHLCYVSSTAAIGRRDNAEFATENMLWKAGSHNSNYSVSKYSAEMEVWRGVEEGLNAVIVNPSIIFGPGNWNESSIGIFRVVANGLKFYTPGINAFVDARDVATAMCELSDQKIFNERFLLISENLPFKEVFDYIANEFNVKPPSVKVKRWMAGLAWRLSTLKRILFFSKQTITKETSRSAMSVSKFSNQKITDRLNFQFIPIQKSVENTSKFLKQEFKSK